MGPVSLLAAVLLGSLPLRTLAAQDVNGNPVLRLGNVVPIDSPNTFYSDLHPCPAACLDNKPANWTVYSSPDRLSLCTKPVLFDLAIYSTADSSDAQVKVRACTPGAAKNANASANALFLESTASMEKRTTGDSSCLSTGEQTSLALEYAQRGSLRSEPMSTVSAALEELQKYLGSKGHCDESFMLVQVNGTVAGAYVGSSLDRAKSVSSVSSRLVEQVKQNGAADLMVAQLCGESRNANHGLGIAVDTTGDFTTVRSALRSWFDAECVDGLDTSETWEEVTVYDSDADLKPSSSASSGSDIASRSLFASLRRRAQCSTTTVVAGDSCAALATRCGISPADFAKYNDQEDLCPSPAPGQAVCCSEGTLPDIRPKQRRDGTCTTYYVNPGDNCSNLGAANGLTIKQIEEFNNGTTWGWNGCQNLNYGINICLSTGDPPMPAPVPNAVCGPTKAGTTMPTDGTDLADLNPCPLNVCCNIWGQCGITEDFCIEERGPAGNPGTSKLKNGCVSSCGTDIKNNDVGPSSFGRVGYYETWNFDRKCLNLRAENANTDASYTHMHWAFAGINTDDWTVSINDTFGQWDDFLALGAKRIVSFGGWGFSTEPGTYDILRQAMNPTNRATFATNVAKFVEDEGLDGVDFDWEYPGAIDIPDTPPGDVSDGPNYLKFLTTMRSKLASGKTLSIAAPASYWYLKAFPINNMAKQLDYIVYMTYDLHGQWDAGNQYTMEGCMTGNCLRSHVNLTETGYTLSMITKAGVPSNKIFVGESSYGRSFHMAEEGCTGPDCFFTGDRYNSEAQKGQCTDTAGYISNAEINRLLSTNPNAKTWHDGGSNSDIMVWDDLEWVAFMSETTKSTRRDHWQGLNFAGTIDWAVDLQSFTDDDYAGPSGDEGPPEQGDIPPLADCDGSYESLEDIESHIQDIPENCISQYILVVLKAELDDALARHDALMEGGYDDSFDVYAGAVVNSGEKQVEKFMLENGDEYFSCIVTETIWCCPLCYDNWAEDSPDCRYCGDFDCGWDSICDQPEVITCDPPNFEYLNMSQPCPPDYSLRGEHEPVAGDRYSQSVYWTLEDDEEDDFWADLYTETGIDKDNIAFKNINHYECAPTDDHCGDRNWDYNFPVPEGYEKDDVINPEDIVREGRKNYTELRTQLDNVLKDIESGAYLGDASELVDAIDLPISMLSNAVDNMESIVEIAEDIREQQRKAILLAFLSAIFFFVPVVGEIASAISSLATIGRIISLIGAAGNAALDIYTIVDDPENAPLAIMGLIFAPLALTDLVAVSKAAKIRRGMSAEQIKTLGDSVATRLDTIGRVKGMCKA